jgi:glyoxylase-like metal-dependent hydrolase (beta-lactamase superfamily II)
VPTPSPAAPSLERIGLGIVAAYLVRGPGTVLVDAGLPGQEARLARALGRHGVRPGGLGAIVVTHVHSDHVGSARALADRFGAPLLAPAGSRSQARSGRNATGRFTHPLLRLADRLGVAAGAFPPFEPDDLLADGERLDRVGLAATVVATPGHTDHDLSILLDDGSLLLGDLLGGHLLRRDRPVLPFVLHDEDAWRASLGRVAGLPVARAYPGHGRSFDGAALRAYAARRNTPAAGR